MILLVGKSATGKDTIRQQLNNLGFSSVVTYTTRPMRDGEIDGVTYHFVTASKFRALDLMGHFVETTSYNVATGETWYYGSALEDLKDGSVMIVNPEGLKVIKNMLGNKAVSFLITAKDEVIKNRQLKRGDNLKEAERRLEADNRDFRNIEEYIDFSLRSDMGLEPSELAQLILRIYVGTREETVNE